jgi:hypothetical protein
MPEFGPDAGIVQIKNLSFSQREETGLRGVPAAIVQMTSTATF